MECWVGRDVEVNDKSRFVTSLSWQRSKLVPSNHETEVVLNTTECFVN